MKIQPKLKAVCYAVTLLLAQSVYAAQTPPAVSDTHQSKALIGGIIENYAAQVTDKAPGALKTVKIINNTKHTIYPIVRTYGLSEPKNLQNNTQREFRIYVGHFSGLGEARDGVDHRKPELGIPAGKRAVVTLPMQLWNAGRIVFLTSEPNIPSNSTSGQPDQNFGHVLSMVDTIRGSTNYGDVIFSAPIGQAEPLDSRSQLAEYTIETNNVSANDFHIISDRNTVDYDISYVDEIYLPLAVEVDTGAMGYVGSTMRVEEMQQGLKAYISGEYTQGYFGTGENAKMGWPSFQLDPNNHYDADYVKVPAGYNVFALSNLYDVRSSFNTNQYMLTTNLSSGMGGDSQAIEALANRWLGWLPNGVYAGTCKYELTAESKNFCNDFATTVQYVWHYATQAEPNKTPVQILQDLIGYTGPFNAGFNPAYDPSVAPAIFNKDQAFRDSVKSLLRGVPYPFWNYDQNTQWYPSPNSTLSNSSALADGSPNFKQKYNLDPMVWFVHKNLNMSGYGFSIDDDTANVEAPGTGFVLTVGGPEGLPNPTPYDPDTKQLVSFGGGKDPNNDDHNKPNLPTGWSSVSSDRYGKCYGIDPTTGAGACDVSLHPGTPYKTATFTAVAMDGVSVLKFTLGYGDAVTAGSKQVYPLVMVPNSCSVTGNLDPNFCSNPNFGLSKVLSPVTFQVPASNATGGGPTPPTPPTPPNGSTMGTLYLAENWGSVVSGDDNCTLALQGGLTNGSPGAVAFTQKDKATSCTMKLTGAKDDKGDFSNIVTHIAVTFNADKTLSATCSGDCKTPLGGTGTNINVPDASTMGSSSNNGGANTGTLALAAGWDTITGDSDCSVTQSNVGQANFSTNTSVCNLTLKGHGDNNSNVQTNITLKFHEDKSIDPAVTCSGNCHSGFNIAGTGNTTVFVPPAKDM